MRSKHPTAPEATHLGGKRDDLTFHCHPEAIPVQEPATETAKQGASMWFHYVPNMWEVSGNRLNDEMKTSLA